MTECPRLAHLDGALAAPLAALAALATLVATTLARSASGQPASQEVARAALLRQAEEAARRGDHARAVEVARRAAEIRATPSVAHFLAREHERLAQPVEALAQATACARGAEADRTLHNRAALLRACTAVAARASSRVARVTLRVADPAPPGVTVRVRGVAIPPALLGVAYAVEPGVVTVDAAAEGYEPERRELTVEAGASAEVELSLRPSPPPEAPPTPAPAATAPEPAAPAPIVSARPEPPSRAPWIAVGAGLSSLAAASFVVAGVAFAASGDARAERDAACPSPCSLSSTDYPAAAAADQRYRDGLELTTYALAAGGVASVGAALWWWLARPSRGRVTPSAAPTARGAVFGLRAVW